ncbi:glycoside hydrolase family 79 protein [Collybiopsis luxurians FD-317 M1]|uniref:Glycoside hydrolase family 79 protein n=1 Tax=Collybiopsis luxurians FD-317 M1 TaxID=944289 RepID=A0A0D0C9B9_9AGAR|nr:glycoside hydrolase family 79 protein [Collybiopsis luxurians FD-317 M1]
MESLIRSFILVAVLLRPVYANITVYGITGQQVLDGQTATNTAAAANYTGSAAYNPTVLNAPQIPTGDQAPATQFTIQLQNGGTSGLSITQQGSFLGFSIEMSVANQVLGKNSTFIQVPFLNLMANLAQRGGAVNIRVGGNTQDFAVLVDSLPDGKILQKDINGASNPTNTPPLQFTEDLLVMMRKISEFVNVRWYLGIPFNDTNWRLGIVERGEAILGDYLLGMQAANEPDLYADHLHRNKTYGPNDYLGEVQSLVSAMKSDSNIQNPNCLIAPNLATGDWTPEMVWDTGFVDALDSSLAYLSVEHYPTDNCAAQFGSGTLRDPQTEFPNYLNHTSGQSIVQPYLNSTAFAQSKGKKFLMMETNTASCGGFAGLSDSFGAALWALDYSMQMAYGNFSGALLHVGGQNVFYNPFTPPPTNQSTFHQWTIGPVYYSTLIVAEALGTSNQSQILDLSANNNNIYTPAYAVYEKGNPVRVALFNYITDPSGASDYTASIAIGGGQTGTSNATPGQVKVKYLLAPSVSEKSNITWAGQTFGDHFASDGRPTGTESIQTITCDTSANTCSIKVPAPGFALVFLTDDALSESGDGDQTTMTFPTTAYTKLQNTATVDPQVLATSNGDRGGQLGSTSKGSANGGMRVTMRLAGTLPWMILMTVLGWCFW